MAFPRVEILHLTAPVCLKRIEQARLQSLPPLQNLPHRQGQVVIAQQLEHLTKIGKCPLMTFEKRLLRLPPERAIKRRPTNHRTHAEELQHFALATQLDRRLWKLLAQPH